MRSFVLLVGAVALVACQSTPLNPTTFNFDRPADVDLVCLRVTVDSGGHVVPNSTHAPRPQPVLNCNPYVTLNMSEVQFDTGSETGFAANRLFAVVTQSDRGELAVVNLDVHNDLGPVDNDPTIPGYTFIPVGMFPSAVSVDPTGAVTYVANSGGTTVSVIDNRTLLRGGSHDELTSGGVIVRHQYPSSPTDLTVVQHDTQTLLIAVLRDTGLVAITDVTDPRNPGIANYVTLGSHLPGMDGGTGGGDAGIDGSEAGTGTAQPLRIAVATDDNGLATTLYINDAAQPIIHVLQLMGGSSAMELEALHPGVPTRTLTITPPILSMPGSPRFVYAVSSVDGTLLVLDAAGGSPILVNALLDRPECQVGTVTFDLNRCPRINPNVDYYRIPLFAPVQSLTVSTRNAVVPPPALPPDPFHIDPTFCQRPVPPPDTDTACAADSISGALPTSTLLSGVQVIVGLRTGQIQVVDVEDFQANCIPYRRGRTNSPLPQPHLLRENLAFIDPPGAVGAPTLTVNGISQPISADLPQVVPIGGTDPAACGSFGCILLPLLIGSDPPVINALAVRNDTWNVTYEGILPGLHIATAAFMRTPAGSPTPLILRAPGAEFCTHGTLPVASGNPGDFVSISTSSPCITDPTAPDAGPILPPSPNFCHDPARCQAVFGTDAVPCNRDLVIQTATNDTVTLTVPSSLVIPPNGGPAQTVYGQLSCSSGFSDLNEFLDLLKDCYPEATPADVRAHGTWIVVGNSTGYQHNVIAGSDGTCVSDTTHFQTGRLTEGVAYTNDFFAIQINAGTADDPNHAGQRVAVASPRAANYQFQITNGYTPLLLNGTILPSAMLYSCAANQLYVVDQSQNGLLYWSVAPLAALGTLN